MNAKISNFMQVASVSRYKITSGKEEGLNVIDCNNGKLRFLLNESKGLDVMQLYHNGTNISFLSKNAFTNREMPFENRFEGGMLYTCGFDSIARREGYIMHGSYHLSTAEVTRAECNEMGIIVEANIRNSALFGKNLVIKRRVYSEINSDTVRVSDTLVNEAYGPEDYCVLYHVNFGYPMLDEGAKIDADISSIEPVDDWAKQHFDVAMLIEEPKPLKPETCYFMILNEPKVSLTNEKLGKKCTLKYSGDTLPCFVEWKSMACGDYALGLEPSTTHLHDRFEYDTIDAGESIDFFIELTEENV